MISPALRACGWRDDLRAAEGLTTAGRLARVIEQHRSGYVVTDGERDFRAQSPAEWTRANLAPEERAAVGDWVWLDPQQDQIERLLPRESLLKRGAAGEHYKRQLIAANIDTVFVVAGLDGDFNPRRLERYVMLVRASGGDPVLVLTKADLGSEAADARAALATLDCPVVIVNAREPSTREALAPWLGAGRSAVLVGSSGAGKSTLTNTLLGIERQKTKAVRERDSRGRHTTTHRSLIRLPDGACLIDTPGMRELKLTGEETLDAAGFTDIDELAAGCRFRDCRHEREPGCAVQAALDAGVLDAGRWTQYLKLQVELAQASASAEAQRARRTEEKVQGKALNRRLIDKYGRR